MIAAHFFSIRHMGSEHSNMSDAQPRLEMSYIQVTDLAAHLGTYVRYLRAQVLASSQRNIWIRISQTIQGRLLDQLESEEVTITVSLNAEEVTVLKTLLKDIKPIFEQMAASPERERNLRSLLELQLLFTRTLRITLD
jgi:hypothetical protein